MCALLGLFSSALTALACSSPAASAILAFQCDQDFNGVNAMSVKQGYNCTNINSTHS